MRTMFSSEEKKLDKLIGKCLSIGSEELLKSGYLDLPYGPAKKDLKNLNKKIETRIKTEGCKK